MTQDLNNPNVAFINNIINKTTTYHLGASGMENITRKVYGVGIEMLESPNDTTHEFSVDGSMNLEKDERVKQAIADRELDYNYYGDILDDLCNKGLIEPGQYFIRVSW